MLIGISGKKRTGKDTAAGIIRTFFAEEAIFLAFGDHLKSICAETFVVPLNYYYDQNLKEVSCGAYGSPRDHMTGLSDIIKAKYGSDFFLKMVERSIEDLQREGFAGPIIVTDVRYDEEAELIRRSGGSILVIERDTGEESDHSSEVGIKYGPNDGRILNNGSLREFREKLYGFVSERVVKNY